MIRQISARVRVLSVGLVLAGLAGCGSASAPSPTPSAIRLSVDDGHNTRTLSNVVVHSCGPISPVTGPDMQSFAFDITFQPIDGLSHLRVILHDGPGGAGTYGLEPTPTLLVANVYLADTATAPDISALEKQLPTVRGFVSDKYITKAQAEADRLASDPSFAQAEGILGYNPLPNAITVNLSDVAGLAEVQSIASANPAVAPVVHTGANQVPEAAQGIAYGVLDAGGGEPRLIGATFNGPAATFVLNGDLHSGSITGSFVADSLVGPVQGSSATPTPAPTNPPPSRWDVSGTFAC